MAKVFLDTNKVIDYIQERATRVSPDLQDHSFFISPLSVHILFYVTKSKVPNGSIDGLVDLLFQVDFNESITEKALLGPTDDFEDNVQLHSAAQADCDFFLTDDKDLLRMRYFGKVEIVGEL